MRKRILTESAAYALCFIVSKDYIHEAYCIDPEPTTTSSVFLPCRFDAIVIFLCICVTVHEPMNA